MRPGTDACPVGARGARSRASQVASIGCPARARGGAEAQRRGLSCFLPLVEVEFRSRRRRRDRGDGLYASQVVLTRRCVAVGASTTRRGGRTSSGCVADAGDEPGQAAHWPRSKIWASAALRRRVAAPTVLKGKRGVASGADRVLGPSLLRLVKLPVPKRDEDLLRKVFARVFSQSS